MIKDALKSMNYQQFGYLNSAKFERKCAIYAACCDDVDFLNLTTWDNVHTSKSFLRRAYELAGKSAEHIIARFEFEQAERKRCYNAYMRARSNFRPTSWSQAMMYDVASRVGLYYRDFMFLNTEQTRALLKSIAYKRFLKGTHLFADVYATGYFAKVGDDEYYFDITEFSSPNCNH